MSDTLPRRAKGQTHRDYVTELQAAGVRYPHTATRSVRRALSRDVSRALAGPTQRQPSRGFYADLVNARVPMTVRPPSRRSGQMRVNAKRNKRAEHWRTVKIRVHPDLEQPFREHLHLLGAGTRIQGRSMPLNALAIDLDVHIPGAPAHAVQAEPVYSGVLDDKGGRYLPHLDYVVYRDADGQVIDIEAEQLAGAGA